MENNMKGFAIGVTLISFIMLFGFVYLLGKSTPSQEDNASILSIDNDDWVYGNRDSKVVLVEYADYECEACAAASPMVETIKAEYKDKIAFVVRYFPLPGHQYSKQSAYAVESAGKQGKYWEMNKLMFQNQIDWSGNPKSDEIFRGYAQDLGLNIEQFNADSDSAQTKEKVENDLKSGKDLNIQGTPTFFLNGRKIPTPRNIESFRKLLDEEIKKSSSTE